MCSFIFYEIDNFQTMILIFRRGNFVFPHWGCTLIYLPLFKYSCYICRYPTIGTASALIAPQLSSFDKERI